MKELKIITKTPRGESALRQHWKESRKLRNMAARVAFKRLGYRQSVYSENPFCISIKITNQSLSSLLKPKDLISKINESMKENGAEETDYKIEVIE